MLGRTAILQKMMGALIKEVPDHLQVIGPKFSGKTVVLHELAACLQNAGSPYSAVVLWDLGHQTPGTDELFMQGLARELSSALKDSHHDYAEHLKDLQGNPYRDIAEVLDLLKEEGSKVLVIMDGFDKPLANGELTRNLWDQLLDLARKPSLRLVTASRRSLYQLLRSPESQTSDFWGIFDTKVNIGCFDDCDMSSLLASVPPLSFSTGAQTELWNASNGFPIFTLGVLNAVCETNKTGIVSPEAMRGACESAFPALRDKLDALWIDCSPSCQDLLRRVMDEGTVTRAGIATADADVLIERGFVHSVANKIQRPSRLLIRYLEEQSNEENAIARLFRAQEDYLLNMRHVLERRITQISGIDKELQRYLILGIRELPDFPKVFFSNIRGIIDRALEMIWSVELDQKRVPSEWTSVWRANGESKSEEWLTRFPQGGQRLRLLDLMTGNQRSDACAKYVTKSTYVLANAVQGFGDFGQHQEGAPVDPCTAYSALHLCVELTSALARELPSQ
ncbi:ATP-binding protein [Pseudomonas chlororaphis]|uniref:ATP-binding protein n=2 Tax=Pseudomonas chlororaphis TaxID=587753 RepID=UPI001F14D52E|nr:ATP-binding protein [Pseudomonas chlororaphis]